MTNYSSVYEIAENYEGLIRKLVYPVKPNKPNLKNYPNVHMFADDLDIYDTQISKYNNDKSEYNSIHSTLLAEFQNDLLEYLEISNHPKASKLYSMAWESGHSSGLTEVANKAEELSELLV